MLIKTLKAYGHTCDEAEDGQMAVRMVKEKGLTAHDAILMDFVMVSPSPSPHPPIHRHYYHHTHILAILFSSTISTQCIIFQLSACIGWT